MAPEQAIGEQIGPWTDLYALGVIAFELFTGRVPFAGNDMAVMVRHLHDPVPSVSRSATPASTAGIAAWIGRLLVKDPAQRTSSAAARLGRARGDRHRGPGPALAAQRAAWPRRSRRSPTAAGGASAPVHPRRRPICHPGR